MAFDPRAYLARQGGKAGPAFDEKAFQSWYRPLAAHLGIDPNPDDPEHHYDYRAYYTAMKQGRVTSPDHPGGHFTSEFKTAGHPREYLADRSGKVFSTKTGAYVDGGAVPQAEMDAAENAPDLPPERVPHPQPVTPGGFDPKAHAAKMLNERRADVILNPRTGMPLDTSPDMGPGKVTPEEGASMLGPDDIKPSVGMNAGFTFLPEDTQLYALSPEERRQRFAERAAIVAGTAGGAALPALAAAGGVGAALTGGAGTAFGLGMAGLSGAAGGLASGATKAAVEGKPGNEIAQEASDEGLTGAALSGGLHGAGELATAGAKLLRSGPGLVARYLRAKDAGVYETPEMANLPDKAAGVQQAARAGHNRVVDRMAAQQAEETAAYHGALDVPEPPLLSPKPDIAPGPRNSALDRYENLRQQRRLGLTFDEGGPAMRVTPEGVPLEPSAPTGLRRPIAREKLLEALGQQHEAGISPDTGIPFSDAITTRQGKAIAAQGPEGTVNTIAGTLGQRRALRDEAAFGSAAATPEQLAARKVYGNFRESVRKAAPDVGAADDRYAEYAHKADRARDILYRSTAPVSKPAPGETAAEPADVMLEGGSHGPAAELEPGETMMRVGKEQAGITRMMRQGDENIPGLHNQEYLDELGRQDPEFAAALKFIGDKKALVGTRFGANHLPTGLGEATAHLGVGKLAVPMRYLGQNARAVAAQGLDPIFQAGQHLKLAAPFSGAVTNPLFEARDEEVGRRKRRATSLRSGGHE